jgi:hypothetical protein
VGPRNNKECSFASNVGSVGSEIGYLLVLSIQVIQELCNYTIAGFNFMAWRSWASSRIRRCMGKDKQWSYILEWCNSVSFLFEA